MVTEVEKHTKYFGQNEKPYIANACILSKELLVKNSSVVRHCSYVGSVIKAELPNRS